MIALILCSHADFSIALRRTTEMICGDLEKCETVSLTPDGSLAGITQEIREKYDRFHAQGDSVVCLCDLPSATPFNACCAALGDTDARVIPGMSLPLLINIASDRDDVAPDELDAFLNTAIADSRESMALFIPREIMEA